MLISVSENQRWRPQIQFTVIEKKRNHKIFTFKNLESENVDSIHSCGSGTIFDIVISRPVTRNWSATCDHRVRGSCVTSAPGCLRGKSPNNMREGGREGGAGYTCQVQRQFLFTYVKDTIWSPVNLQRPAEPHLAVLQTPNSQVRGRIPSLGRKTTGFVNKVGGWGRSSPAVPPPSVWGRRLPKLLCNDRRLSQVPRLQDEVEAGLFWADVTPPRFGRILGSYGNRAARVETGNVIFVIW